VNLSVRVNSPGNDGSVSQSNDATVSAAAAEPTAIAGQSSPANVNASIRVASPGASNGVNQTNTASAFASGAQTGVGIGAQPVIANPSFAPAVVANSSSIDQTMTQCGSQCPAGAAAPPGAPTTLAAALGPSVATATQTNPTNVNISVRIGSAGADPAAMQASSATASAATATATTTGASNVDVRVVLPGGMVVVPSSDQAWRWNWTWTLDVLPTDASAAPTATADWTWSWTSTPTGAAAGLPAPVAGHWIWTWTWTGSNGVSVRFSLDQACACTWLWNWTWTGEPASASHEPATTETVSAEPAPKVTQSNAVSATASAFVSSDAVQTAALQAVGDPAASPFLSRQISSSQVARADAHASQTNPINVNVVTAGILIGLDQGNRARAESTAIARLAAWQTISVSADVSLHNSAGTVQSIASSQSAAASSQAVQTNPFNLNRISSVLPSNAAIGAVQQENDATATAFARALSTILQSVSQLQGGTGLQSAFASQTAAVSQASTASSHTAQANVGNVNDVVIPEFGVSNPPLSQTWSLGSYALASSSSEIRQTVNQAFTNSSDTISVDLHAQQEGKVIQSGTAASAQAQAWRTNTAGWTGIVSPPAAVAQASTPPSLQSSGPAQSQAQTEGDAMTSRSQTSSTVSLALPPPLRGLPALPALSPISRSGAGSGSPGGRPAAPALLPGSSEGDGLDPRSQAGNKAASASGPASSSGHTPACERQCELDLLLAGAVGSVRGSGSGDAVAALSRRFTFALPGAGRAQFGTTAPRESTFVAPFERPG
jgi:hypothetical protein